MMLRALGVPRVNLSISRGWTVGELIFLPYTVYFNFNHARARAPDGSARKIIADKAMASWLLGKGLDALSALRSSSFTPTVLQFDNLQVMTTALLAEGGYSTRVLCQGHGGQDSTVRSQEGACAGR